MEDPFLQRVVLLARQLERLAHVLHDERRRHRRAPARRRRPRAAFTPALTEPDRERRRRGRSATATSARSSSGGSAGGCGGPSFMRTARAGRIGAATTWRYTSIKSSPVRSHVKRTGELLRSEEHKSELQLR